MTGHRPAGPDPGLHPRYRADIDGLRAIAVLSVIGFHAFPGWIKGGFIGVDVFFVISGYLISSIILANLDIQRFNFVDFYSRRVQRIFPALIVVLSACFIFAWHSLFAGEFEQLGKHIAAGASFLSNFAFWSESGYFDQAAETKPLLHLWSLGIEEQFYIFWPLLLWIAWRVRFNAVFLIAFVGLASFALNVVEVRRDEVAAFYSPLNRFWELLVGATLAYLTLFKPWMLAFGRGTAKNAVAGAGSALLAAGFLLINRDTPFPGAWALLPTVGVVLLIASGPDAWFNRLIANRVFVWFGKISYPLYLWHWPFLSFISIIYAEYAPSAERRLVAIFLAIVCAWLTYRLVEAPFRFGRHANAKAAGLTIAMVVVGSAGLFTYKANGFDGHGFRTAERQAFASYYANNPPDRQYFARIGRNENFREDCSFYDSEKSLRGQGSSVPLDRISPNCYQRDLHFDKSVFIWGDSHAQHLYIGLKHNLPENWQILQVASSGCSPNVSAVGPSATNWCIQSNWFALKAIAEARPDVVICAQVKPYDVASRMRLADALLVLGVRKVIFNGPSPSWTADLPNIIVRRLWNDTPRRTFTGVHIPTLERNRELHNSFKNTDSRIYANIIDVFCNQDGCLTYLGDDRKTGLTSFDYGHLTAIGSDYLARNLLVPLITGQQTTPY